MEYIAGRPFAVDGGNVEPGDRLTRAQLESIPYLESFVSSGYIYPVYTKKDYNRLPPHLFTAVMAREDAKNAMRQNVALVPVKQQKDQEAGDEDQSRKESAAQARIDRNYVAEKMIREVDPVNPIPTKVEKPEDKPVKQDASEETTEAEDSNATAPDPDAQPVDEPVDDKPAMKPAPVVPTEGTKTTARKTTGK